MELIFRILPDQVELLEKFRQLPDIVQKHIGDLPASFPPSTEVERIKELCTSLEFKWKQWVWQSFLVTTEFAAWMEGTKLAKGSEYMYERDY